MTKADQVRARIAQAKLANEQQADIVTWAIENLAMKSGQAKQYVRDLWNEEPKTKTVSSTKAKKEPTAAAASPKSKTMSAKPQKKAGAAVNSLSELRDVLKADGVEITSFDGAKIVTPNGTYSMFAREVFLRSPDGKTVLVSKASDFRSKKATLHFV